MVDKVNKYFPVEIPISEKAMEYATNWVLLDNSKEEVLDFGFRPVEDSMAETIRWLYRAGHISEKQAGRGAVEQQDRGK